jgi:hypothetical protein
MFKKTRIVLALFLMIALSLACANPIEGNNAPPNVETIVAATLQALTVTAAPQDSSPGLLPHAMYFLNNDITGLAQIFRLDKDGTTVTQLTFEPANVDNYDVSRLDGSLVYVTNNQLLTVNADGGNRSMIVDGGPQDPSNPLLSSIMNPLWSPDGGTIAFGQKDLKLYSIIAGQPTVAVANSIDSNGFGTIYWPLSYSPDGSKLMISVVPIATDASLNAIYSINGGTLTSLQYPPNTSSICCSFQWTADSSTLYSGVRFLSPFTAAGLWKVNAADGQVSAVLASDEVAENFNLAGSPYLGPDGQLYFVYGNQSGLNDFVVTAPLQLVRSAADGVTNRTVLRPETFNTSDEYLWAPDSSFVIVTIPSDQVGQGSAAQLYYTDGQKAMVPLVPAARYIKWGP